MARFTNHNWQKAWAKDMETVYYRQLDPLDRRRYVMPELFHVNIFSHYLCLVDLKKACALILSRPLVFVKKLSTRLQCFCHLASFPSFKFLWETKYISSTMLKETGQESTQRIVAFRRAEKLEIFDELEEWHLIQASLTLMLSVELHSGALNSQKCKLKHLDAIGV